MTTRILPPADWPLLEGTELETVYPCLDPQTAKVIVVEDGALIVGCWALLPILHAECIWIHPDYRKRLKSPAVKLLRGMKETARASGAKAVITAALTDDVVGLIEHVGGVELPGRHFVMGVTE